MSKHGIPQEPNLLSSAFKDHFDQKNSMPGAGQDSFCSTLAAALTVRACNAHRKFNTSKEFPSAQRVRAAVEKSSLCRGLIPTNFHSIGSYQFLFPSLSGHRALQAEAGGWGSALSPRGWDLGSDCNGVSCTCSHNQHHGEKIQVQVWVASACWSPCHSLQIKAIAGKPEKLSGRVGLKNESHLHWKMRAVHRHNTQPSNLLDTQSEMCTVTIAQIWNLQCCSDSVQLIGLGGYLASWSNLF